MAVDSDSPVPKPSRDEPRDAADLERGELEQEQTDSQMTDAPSSPEPAHSSINPSDWSSPAEPLFRDDGIWARQAGT